MTVLSELPAARATVVGNACGPLRNDGNESEYDGDGLPARHFDEGLTHGDKAEPDDDWACDFKRDDAQNEGKTSRWCRGSA